MVLVARPVAVESTQIGIEAQGSEGIAVPTTRVLQSLGITLDPEVDINVFGPAGQLFDTAAILNREWATGGLTGIPDYREGAYPLTGVFGNAVVSAVSGTDVYDWLWTPRSAGGLDRPRTFSVEQGVLGLSAESTTFATLTAFNQNFSRAGGTDQGGALFARRLAWDAALSTNERQTVTITGGPTGGTFQLTLNGEQTAAIAYNATASAVQTALIALPSVQPGDVLVTGGPGPSVPYVVEFRGQYAQADVTLMTASHAFTGGTTPAIGVTQTTAAVAPAADDVTPVMPGEVNVYVDTLYSAIGTSQFTGDFAAGWGIGDRRNPVWTLNRNLKSFASIVETKPNPTATLSVNNDDAGRALVDVMRSGAGRYIRIECVGPEIIPGFNYEYVVDLFCKISEAPGRGDVDGARSLDWTFRVMHSAAWGKAMQIRMRTNIGAL